MKKIILILFIFSLSTLYSQIDYSKITGISKLKLDTLAHKNAIEVSKETFTLLEKAIDAKEYKVGPGDVFEFSVFATEPISYTLKVTPENKILIPTVGLIDVKNLYLDEVYELVNEKIKKVYKTSEVGFILTKPRQFKVIISGSVTKSMSIPSSPTDRASEVIERAGGLKYDASLRNISLIRGEQVIQIDLLKFFLAGIKEANPFMEGGDQIIIPPSSERQKISIYGEVGYPGEFEFMPGDSLSTLIRFAQGFLASAQLDSVEISRFDPNEKKLIKRYIDLSDWKDILNTRGNLKGDIPLEIGDRVMVRIIPNWNKEHYVVIAGEVKYPGKYAIIENKDRIYDLILRCGGFTEDASITDIEFVRQQEAEKRDLEMDRLYRTPSTEMSEFEQRYFQSRVREKRGSMTLNWNKAISEPMSDQNITLFNKDSIIVPTKKNYINVQGRVNNPGNVVFKEGWTYMDYINQAGGFGYRADENETFIAKSKGEIFLAKDMKYVLEPGDVILVPPEKEVSFTEVFKDIITTIAQLTTILGVLFTIYTAAQSSK